MFFSKFSAFLTCVCILSKNSGAYGAVEIIQDGDYILEYNLLANETLSVTATVKTLGWVGVGLSQTGDMAGADLIIGGVANGEEYIGDYFAFSNTRPIEDIVNDVLTYTATENATHTTLTFTRLSDTGDEMEDLPVARSTHIIWAYSSTDGITYHGNINRGSVLLFVSM